jgi:hypothetical protein
MECFTSISKSTGLLFVGLAMVLLSWFCTTIPRPVAQIAGWAGVVFFGLCLPEGARQMFRTGPAVVLNENGIQDFRRSLSINWRDVESLWIGCYRSQRFLCVEVNDETVHLAQMPVHQRLMAKANQSFGFPAITIAFAGVTPGLDEVWAYIENHYGETSTSARCALNPESDGM